MNEPMNTPAGAADRPPSAAPDPAERSDDAAQRVRDRSAEAGRDVRHAADEVREKVAATAGEVGDRVKDQAKQTGEKLKEQSRSFLNEQKGRVAAEIQTYSAAARRAAERLENYSDTNPAEYVSTAAERLDQLGRRIQERDLGQLVDDVEGMAGRRPEVFFGVMFVAGLAAARFLKASKARRQRDESGSDRQLALRRPNPAAPRENFGAGRATEFGSADMPFPPTVGVAGRPPGSPGNAGAQMGGTI
ncbi:hypothetical protein BH18VER1_BH18VER1_17850 [soil metagenome]